MEPIKRGRGKPKTTEQTPVIGRHLKFCEVYMRTNNIQLASDAIGVSRTHGGKILGKVNVQYFLRQAQAHTARELGLRAADLAQATMDIAYADPSVFFKEDGSCRAIHEIPEGARRSLAGIERIESPNGTVTWKYKIADRNNAQDRLGKHIGFYREDNAQKAEILQELFAFVAERQSGGPPIKR
jgi:hypothetical protein